MARFLAEEKYWLVRKYGKKTVSLRTDEHYLEDGNIIEIRIYDHVENFWTVIVLDRLDMITTATAVDKFVDNASEKARKVLSAMKRASKARAAA